MSYTVQTRTTMSWHIAESDTSIIGGPFVNAPCQWETTLHCNVVSHWLDAHKMIPDYYTAIQFISILHGAGITTANWPWRYFQKQILTQIRMLHSHSRRACSGSLGYWTAIFKRYCTLPYCDSLIVEKSCNSAKMFLSSCVNFNR